MALNLHNTVRGAIQSINPDQDAVYRASSGATQNADFTRSPTYVDTAVRIQVQALSGRDLRHESLQNLQGVVRAVYMYGNTQGVSRPDLKGGDLLQFKQNLTDTQLQTWLVVAVLETWQPTPSGWCKLAITLQTDAKVDP